MQKEILEKAKAEFERALKFLEGEVAKIRTSRANPSMIEDIKVDILGEKLSLKQIGAISAPQMNQLSIQPWDTSYVEPIERAIHQSGLGLSLSVDKNQIWLTLPQLTQEYRQQLVKILNEKAEAGRESVRKSRDEAWSQIQKAEKEKKISQDDKFRSKTELQKVVDGYNEKIKNVIERKKQEIS